MTRATLVSKVNMPGHFTSGKTYKAIYEMDAEDKGWFTTDDSGAIHWLSPWDGKDHSNICHEAWIMKNFMVIEAK